VLGTHRDLDRGVVRREFDDDGLVAQPRYLAGVRLMLPRVTVDRHQQPLRQALVRAPGRTVTAPSIAHSMGIGNPSGVCSRS
jgi:hypothetical protein